MTGEEARATSRGWTPRELGKMLRVSPDRVRAWIESGELQALNTAPARCGRPRYVVMPWHLAAWEQTRRASQPTKAPRQRRAAAVKDYYAD